MLSDDETDALLHAAMARLVGDLEKQEVDLEQVLCGVTGAAVDLIGGIDEADVLMIEDGQFRSMAPTSPLAIEFDNLQLRLQEGPCLAAAVADSTIRCPDLRTETRWPDFAAAAVTLGVHSALSFQLDTHHNGAGALNLLGRRPQTFTLEAEAVGAMLATHASTALTVITQHHQFKSALASRDTISQAKGILMERFNIDATDAFSLLTRLSQNTNIPLRDIAARLLSSLNKNRD